MKFYQSYSHISARAIAYLFHALTVIVLVSAGFMGCKKFITVDPPKTQIAGAVVFNDDNTALAAVTGIYSQMSGSSGNFIRGGNQGFSYMAGLSSDELISFSTTPNQNEFYNNSLSKTNSTIASLWAELYKYIFSANSIIEGVNASSKLSTPVKNQLIGEASFIRAYNYFYMVNMFGDVPLAISSDYEINRVLKRSSVASVYGQVISDLVKAESLLPESYSSYRNERVRPCKYTASALLARIYLYQGEFVKAEQKSNEVISNTGLYRLSKNLDSVFLKNSEEAIWQLLPVVPGYNTQDAFYFILTASPTNAALSTTLINAFEPGDLRKGKWTSVLNTPTGNYYYPFKYKIKSSNTISEYSMILRLSEQFLIRAEARALQNNITAALDDLNLIRLRSGLSPILTNDKNLLLSAIAHERQTELFTEWGHRWLDLKRTQTADVVLGITKAPNWQPADVLYPIPQSEIISDPVLSQNTGY